MKYDYYKIRELAQKLLTPQKTLDRQLFDINGKLYPEIRKDLLNITDYAIKTSVDIFDVMEVKDIYLSLVPIISVDDNSRLIDLFSELGFGGEDLNKHNHK